MRVELKNRSTTTQAIANDRVIYYFNYPQTDYSSLTWDTFYNSGPARSRRSCDTSTCPAFTANAPPIPHSNSRSRRERHWQQGLR